MKFKSALKSSVNSLECIEKIHEFYYFFVGLTTVDRDLNQYKIVVSLLGAGITILPQFSSTNFLPSRESLYSKGAVIGWWLQSTSAQSSVLLVNILLLKLFIVNY